MPYSVKANSALAQAWLTLEPRLIDIGHMASLASEEMMETSVDERAAFAVHHLQGMIEALISDCRTAHKESGR